MPEHRLFVPVAIPKTSAGMTGRRRFAAENFPSAMALTPPPPLNHPDDILYSCFVLNQTETSSAMPNLEALLRDACRRAMDLGLSLTIQLRIYRSVLALAREVRLRAFGHNETLSALLAAVCEHVSLRGLDPELPLPDAILLHRLAVQLSRAARKAGDPQNPVHREKPASSAPAPARSEGPAQAHDPQYPMHREKPASSTPAPARAEGPAQAHDPQNPIHLEKPASSAPASERAEGPAQPHDPQNPQHREKPVSSTPAPERFEGPAQAHDPQNPTHREKPASSAPAPERSEEPAQPQNAATPHAP